MLARGTSNGFRNELSKSKSQAPFLCRVLVHIQVHVYEATNRHALNLALKIALPFSANLSSVSSAELEKE